MCANTDNWIWSGVDILFQTSSDLLDSSLVDERRFFRPSLSKLFVPGPNREMAPAGTWTQQWIRKSLKMISIKVHQRVAIYPFLSYFRLRLFFARCRHTLLLAENVAVLVVICKQVDGFLSSGLPLLGWKVQGVKAMNFTRASANGVQEGGQPLPGFFWLWPLKK